MLWSLTEAADSLARLAAIYELDIKLLANGIIKHKTNSGEHKTLDSNKTLDAFDCYNIGLNSYLNSDFSKAQLWVEEALKRFSFPFSTEDIELKSDCLTLLAKICFKINKKSKAFDYLRQSLSLMEEDIHFMEPFNVLMVSYQSFYSI